MKRLFDTFIVVALAPIWIVFVAFLAVLVWLLVGRPVFFVQRRPGLRGEIFSLLKFRTMSNARSASGALLPDADRLGKFGGLLRSSSLDELPSLWNVLRGEMSLVGPRPLLPDYLPLYSAKQMRRHEVRPGITGLAQVSGRNTLSWEDKFELDVWYVDHQSMWLDLKILVRTVLKVIRRDGISARGEATMPRFTGTTGQGR